MNRSQFKRVGSPLRWITAMTALFLLSVTTQTQCASLRHPIRRQVRRPTLAIAITHPAHYGAGPVEMDSISGTASVGDRKDCKVVIYAWTNMGYVQPTIADPITDIVNGKWENETHLGYEYVALLVKSSYKPKSTLQNMPSTGGLILAIAKKKAVRK